MKGYFFGEHNFSVEMKQSRWRVILCIPVFCSAPIVESSLCASCSRFCVMCSHPGAGAYGLVSAGASGGIPERVLSVHPSPIQISIIQLLGDSPDFPVLPGQGAQGFRQLLLAEDPGNVLPMGSGSTVCYGFRCPTGGRTVLLEGWGATIPYCWASLLPHHIQEWLSHIL